MNSTRYIGGRALGLSVGMVCAGLIATSYAEAQSVGISRLQSPTRVVTAEDLAIENRSFQIEEGDREVVQEDFREISTLVGGDDEEALPLLPRQGGTFE